MRNVIIDAIMAMTLLCGLAPLFAWLSDLFDDSESFSISGLEMVFTLLMLLSLVAGAIMLFNTYWYWYDHRDQS